MKKYIFKIPKNDKRRVEFFRRVEVAKEAVKKGENKFFKTNEILRKELRKGFVEWYLLLIKLRIKLLFKRYE